VDKPFFLYFAPYAVHAPFNSDPRFAANYKNTGKPASAQAFATLIEGMDKSLGDLLDHLDHLGVAENTLIFFLGDNGSDAPLGHQHEVACAAPQRGKKGSHYEGGVRVAFIAAWAKASAENAVQKRLPIMAGAIQSQQAAVQDLFPTILALTETAIPSGHTVDGLKLNTLLTGKADRRRSETFLMHYPHAPHRSDYWTGPVLLTGKADRRRSETFLCRSATTGKADRRRSETFLCRSATSYRAGEWKVIYHYFPSATSEQSHFQLFNLKADPFEQNNLAMKNPNDLRRMMRGLIAALEEHHALYPVDKDRQPLKPKLP